MSGTSSAIQSSSGNPQKRQRTGERVNKTRVACNPCRKRRTACDGSRPGCIACSQRGLECDYDTENDEESRTDALKREQKMLHDRITAYEKLYPHLKQLTLEELAAITPDRADGVHQPHLTPVASSSSPSSLRSRAAVRSGNAAFRGPPPPRLEEARSARHLSSSASHQNDLQIDPLLKSEAQEYGETMTCPDERLTD